MPSELASLIGRLLKLTPGTTKAEDQQHAIEHELMVALGAGGRESGEALVRSLADQGYELERLRPCFWRVDIPTPRVLELWFNPPEDPVVAALSYRVGTPWGTPRQKRAAERQAAFYARYEKLFPMEEAETAALPPEDRLILLVGEFEADVNNGGFGQYLENKGADRAQEALGYLREIGAGRTARWLSSALKAGAGSGVLDRLDSQFFDKPQDLPSLVMRHLSKHQSPVLSPGAARQGGEPAKPRRKDPNAG